MNKHRRVSATATAVIATVITTARVPAIIGEAVLAGDAVMPSSVFAPAPTIIGEAVLAGGGVMPSSTGVYMPVVT